MGDKFERGEEGLADLRELLKEIVEVGNSRHPGIDAVRDAAAGLDGIDRAEDALGKWRERDIEGEWRHDDEKEEYEALDEKTREAIVEMSGGPAEDEDGLEAALSQLRAAASEEILEASMEEVLAAAERGAREFGGLEQDDVVRIGGEVWEIAPALRALYDHNLTPEDVLNAITRDGENGDGDVLELDHEAARMVLARLDVLDELPSVGSKRRPVSDIAGTLRDGRGEDYVREVLGTLEAYDVADVDDDGARRAHQRVVVEPLVEGGGGSVGGHLSDTNDVDGTGMEDTEQLKARLAMFVSGSSGWVTEAEEAGVDDEVIEEVEEANAAAKRAFDLLDGGEE